MRFRRHRTPRPGQPLSARALRHMAETADWLNRVRVNPPLEIVSGAGCPTLRYAGPVYEAYIAVTTSTVTARSGTTPGSGQADLYGWNGTTLVPIAAGSVNFTVYNFSGTAGGIASGKYCVVQRIQGAYWIISVEC